MSDIKQRRTLQEIKYTLHWTDLTNSEKHLEIKETTTKRETQMVNISCNQAIEKSINAWKYFHQNTRKWQIFLNIKKIIENNSNKKPAATTETD